ncbi:MAG TPA: SLBB domain-containing protein [Terriglobales bacterium]|nr:SLBB domain-containing protein [Terriglobales bacterium]
MRFIVTRRWANGWWREFALLALAIIMGWVAGGQAWAQGLPEMAAAPATAAALPASGIVQMYGAGAAADPVGPGDLLDVRVFGQPQLSGNLRVAPDGSIAPAFVAGLQVAGKTPTEIEHTLALAYGGMLVHPMVSVRVQENNSRRVAVNGEVPRPGVYGFSGAMTLMQALGMAGGVDPVKASQKIFLLHQPPATRRIGAHGTPTYTVNTALETIDLSQLPQHPELNRELEPGDVIDVPEAHQVYIAGDVMHPGAEALLPGLTLTQLVSEAGGFLPQADVSHVRVLRLVTAPGSGVSTGRQELIVDVARAQRNRGPDLTLEADDIVQVPGALLRMAGLELLDFFSGTERWRVQQSVANKVP